MNPKVEKKLKDYQSRIRANKGKKEVYASYMDKCDTDIRYCEKMMLELLKKEDKE
ncbi:hypothetical protein [Carboxylicivirga sp. RSCT41]|uniref:hypothetical protein n=1 Tax=Carboxylicivirga agarovorans TaxID=3417570 RepID=UPI003D3592EF